MWLFSGILHECKAADTTTLWRLKYPREVSRNMHDPQEDKLSKELKLGPIRGDISSAKDVLLSYKSVTQYEAHCWQIKW